MMKRFCLLLLLVTFTTASADHLGSYELVIGGTSAWQHHGLTLTRFGDPMEGEVSIDLGLGPQARAPQPHEKVHQKKFRAGYEGEDISFEVKVADRSYTFVLYPLEHKGEYCLVGTVTIKTPEYTRTAGCWAKRR